MQNSEIAAILAAHSLWCADNATGSRANLAGADLAGADLSRADLTSTVGVQVGEKNENI